MNPAKFAFSKMQFTLMAIVLICAAGFMAYFSMTRDENPIYIVRTAQVTTVWPGASPERVEQLVTDKLEKEIQEMPQIDYIESESKTGISVIRVNILDQYKHMRPIWDELRRKVEDAEVLLPDTAHRPIVDDEYGDIYGIVFAIVWDGFNYRQIKDVADEMRDEILELKDAAKVDIWGIQDERVYIDYHLEKLKEIGLSPEQLRQILTERNIIQSGGIIYGDQEQIAVEPTGNYESVQDIRDTLIEIPDTDKIIKLDDIADVYRSYIDPPLMTMRATGKPSLGLAISMREGGDILQLGEEVVALVDRYQQSYPIGIEFEKIAYQPERVVRKISEFVSNLFQAILIVCAVMLLFLGIRTGFVVASLVPVVILITMFIMGAMDIGLNQITLASLIIALGMLVDNAIVISESIIVQSEQGKKPIDAAISAVGELKLSLLISSLTTSAAFLPFYLAESGTGEYVGSLFLVVTATLLVSWIISLTMIPIFCAIMLKFKRKEKETKKEPYSSRIYQLYRKFLLGILKCRLVMIGALGGTFFLAIFGLNFVPKIFYPPSDTPMFTLEIEMPVGSSIHRTEAVVKQVEEYILENLMVNEKREKGIINWGAYVGTGGPRFRLQHDPEPPNSHYAFLLFNTTSYAIIPRMIAEIDHYIFENFPDAKAKVRPLEEGTPVSNPIEVRIIGKDVDRLFEIADQVKVKLDEIQGPKSINDDWGLKAKKIVIKVDQARAKRAGITNSDIARSLEAAIDGVTLTEFREEDELIPLILRSEAARDVNLIETSAFNVTSQRTGESVPLQQVAEIDVVWEPAIIFRRNRLKTITVFAELHPGFTATEVDQQMIPYLDELSKEWPLGYRWELGGENEESSKAQKSIFDKLPIAALIILFLLMAQFNSFKRTLIILITIPMSFIGVVFGLLVTGSYFGIMTILGVISLAGIVINNAIVLLDRIKIEMEENGLSSQSAVITAAQKRMRPILLTTITTTASLFPLWLGGGPLWEPMAIALIFGLIVATILTLGLVPVLYSLLFNVSYKDFTLDQL